MPLSSCGPRSSKPIPDPATRSLTVLETSTSLAAACEATRAPVWTAMPPVLLSTSTHSPVCSPARISRPSSRRLSRIAQAQWIPRAGAVERREETIASRVHLPSTEPRELAADDLVVFLEEFPPCPVAEVGSMGGRIDDIGEQHGREHPIRLRDQLSPVLDIGEERLQ